MQQLNFYGQFFGCVGIGNHCRALANALDPHVKELSLSPIHPNVSGDQFGLTDNIKANLLKKINPEAPTLAFWYPQTFPQIFHNIRGKKVGYYIFEYNKLPPEYIPILNSLDAVATTSIWAADVLRKNGVIKPVFDVPGGVDPLLFNSKNSKLDERKFKFLHVGKAEERKNTAKIIRAFAGAFGSDRRIRMTLCIHNVHIQGFDSQAYTYKVLQEAGLERFFNKFDIINFVEDLTSVYNSHHAAIFPSNSEGLGLPTLEAMACGLPVITTYNTAMMDYANDTNTILIKDLKEEPVWDPHFFPVKGSHGTWMVPSELQLIEKMKMVYENYEEAAIIGRTAEIWVKENYTWEHAAQKLLQIL